MFSEFIASVAGSDKLCDSLENRISSDEGPIASGLPRPWPCSAVVSIFSSILLRLKRYV